MSKRTIVLGICVLLLGANYCAIGDTKLSQQEKESTFGGNCQNCGNGGSNCSTSNSNIPGTACGTQGATANVCSGANGQGCVGGTDATCGPGTPQSCPTLDYECNLVPNNPKNPGSGTKLLWEQVNTSAGGCGTMSTCTASGTGVNCPPPNNKGE
jgi:hypothetical protein